MSIYLSQTYPIAEPEQYKLHLASWNNSYHPLDVFVRDRSEWDGWNSSRGARNDFNRQFIFSLIHFYPETDRWLFGGAYRVQSQKPINKSSSYEIELLDESRPFIGRMKISLNRPGRVRALKLEKYYEDLVVSEILPSSYTGERFCGYDQIDIEFQMMESIFNIQSPSWKTALENSKGVYLITDTRNGKRYVGSAYGSTGIWSRWACYVDTAHGFSDELTRLIKTSGKEYARKNFHFALLEYFPMKTGDDVVIRREQYWKNVLLTRGRYGYNKN